MIERDDLDPGNATSVEELTAKGRLFSGTLGCGNFGYLVLRPPNRQSTKDDCVITNYPAEWVNRYVERSYKFYDPVAKTYGRSRLPFHWGDRDFLARFTKAERAVLHEATEFGVTRGYSIPTAGPEGDTGGITFCFDRQNGLADLIEEEARLQLFAARFHAAAIRILFGESGKPAAVLTQRETEVLKWAAEGYSSEATATRIGVATSTVNFHIGNCCRKLGGSNKIQTVVLAVRQNLI